MIPKTLSVVSLSVMLLFSSLPGQVSLLLMKSVWVTDMCLRRWIEVSGLYPFGGVTVVFAEDLWPFTVSVPEDLEF